MTMIYRIACALRGRGGESGKKDSWHHKLEIGDDRVAYNLTSVQQDSLILEVYEGDDDTTGG